MHVYKILNDNWMDIISEMINLRYKFLPLNTVDVSGHIKCSNDVELTVMATAL